MSLKRSFVTAILAIVGSSMIPLLCASARAQDSPLTLRSDETNIHILPTVDLAAELIVPADSGPLLYNGGPVMPTVTTYAIFWNPPKLQDGTPTSIPAHYQAVQKNVLADYPGHSLGNNSTQYYQTIGATTTYIQNAGKLGGYYVDTSPYPPSGCTDSLRPSGCITDAQLQAEVKKDISKKRWKPVITNMFLVFTAPGEGSCTDFGCSYTEFCAYHGYITSPGKTIIYANMPYGDLSVCQNPSEPSPNGDPVADAVASTVTHELTEATTDPLLTAWYTGSGNEIGDLCSYNYGTPTWDVGQANESWNANFYLLQQEYDNHAGDCVQVGP